MNNREIKFRVWVEDETRFRYCEFIPTMGFVWDFNGENSAEIGEITLNSILGV